MLLVLHVWLELVHLSVVVLAVESTSVHLLVGGEISTLVLWVLELAHVLCKFNLVWWNWIIRTSQFTVSVSKVALFSHLAGSVLLEVSASGSLVFVVDNLVEVIG